MSDFKAADLNLVLGNSTEAFFLLNERGHVMFWNRGMEDLIGVSRTDVHSLARVESELLRPPADLPPSTPRCARRTWGEGKGRRWLSLTFIPMRDPLGVLVGVFGHACAADRSSDIPSASDALAEERLERMREEQAAYFGFETLPARGEPMLRVLHQLKLAVESDIPVMFIGEIGTGKKTLAQTLHFASERRRRNLAILDCRQMTGEQIRRELIGPAVISSEGAVKADSAEFGGLLHPSQGGTLVVVGVGRLPMDMQELLARETKVEARWRLVATEREPLEAFLADGRLARSLYYLLTRLVIVVPPLRERPMELADHCQWLLKQRRLATAKSEPLAGISPEAMQVLERYDWPGNLVELDAVLQTAARRATKPMLSPRDLPRRLTEPSRRDELAMEIAPLPPLDELLGRVECRMIDLALRLFKGNKSKAAQALGISRPRLHNRARRIAPATPPTRRQPPGDPAID